jgi:glutamate/tyrosine decarboxylase-like PLP-dependent enzyme
LNEAIAAGLPLEIIDPPQLTVVSFRLKRRPGEALGAWNRRNMAVLERINDKGRIYLSSTGLPVGDGNAFTLRVCILSFRTHLEHIQQGVGDIIAAVNGEP